MQDIRSNSTNPDRDAPLPESRFSVILVEPQGPDNIGHVARSMLNFGVGELYLVNTYDGIDHEARTRAVHAQRVLDEAKRVPTLAEVKAKFDHLVGFAARISTLNKSHLRMSEPLDKVAERVAGMSGRVALVFGREDFGLSNEDVEVCDMLCTIPTAPTYRSMNLSHAVTVALYEMLRPQHARVPYVSMASPHEKEVLFATYDHLNRELGFKKHRVDQASMMFHRLIGRAGLTAWEYHRLMGTFSRTLKRLGNWPPPGVGGRDAEPLEEEAGESAEPPHEDRP